MAVTLDLAISAIRAGRKQEGRQLLNLLIQQDPNNETAWLWMSQVVDTDEKRARCLYHVLALNPENQPARRGLQLLGIVVTDSRPVKLPPDLQVNPTRAAAPDQPKQPALPAAPPKTNDVSRRPFLIDSATMTKELPFVPVKPPLREPVQASPAILSLKVDDDEPAPPQTTATVNEKPVVPKNETATNGAAKPVEPPPQKPAQPQNGAVAAMAATVIAADTPPAPEPAVMDASSQQEQPAETATATTEQPASPSAQADQADAPPAAVSVAEVVTQKMTAPAEQPQPDPQPEPAAVAPAEPEPAAPAPNLPAAPQPAGDSPLPPVLPPPASAPAAPQPPQPQLPGQYAQPDIPLETRQSQPVLINYPAPGPGMPPDGQLYYPPGHQMPYLQPGSYPGQNYYPSPQYHNPTTMAMPMLPPGSFNRPPSEPVLPVSPGGGMYGQPMHPGMSLHANATMMMPTMSEAEARARLATSQAIPTANAAAMPLQNGGSWPQPPGFAATGYPQDYIEDDDDEDEDDGEINVLAVIIFGTLSITALGGLGMLVLLIVTTSAPII